jgi:signal transduction histidine kinase/ActR/RegA family two-component response regulator
MKHVVPSLRVWVAIAALAIAAAFVLSYRSIRQNQVSIAAVEHTRQTLSALIAVEGAMADVIFAAGDDAIMRATTAAHIRIDELSALTLDNPIQQQRLVRLRDEIDAVATSRRRGTSTGLDTRAEALVPQSLSRTVQELRNEEVQLLTTRVTASDLMSRRLTSTLIAVGVGSAVLLIWVFGLVVHDERYRRQAEQLLRRTNEELDARVSARTAELHDALDRAQSLRRDAEANSRLKDEFLMTVSHELRTPLNTLLGWSDLLRLGILSKAERQRAVNAIYDNAKLQTQLIADLLDTSRILTGKLRIEPAFVDFSQIVKDAADVVAPAAAAKGLELKVEVDGDGCVFFGDAVRLQQVVGNLVSNAVKFTERGTVSVRLSRSDAENQMHLVVADTGIGIAREFLPCVFDRFTQEKTGTDRPHGGLGLGLAIVRQLVELHGGTVRVHSDGEGRGASFFVSLPILSANKDAAGPKHTADDSAVIAETRKMPALDGVRVLVVDDDAGAREMVTAVLEHCGAVVAAAASAGEARSALARSAYDVMLVDLAMPGEDGFAFVRRMRADGLRHPVAAFTALTHETERVRALESGFDIHIQKPVAPHVLALAVAELLSSRAYAH